MATVLAVVGLAFAPPSPSNASTRQVHVASPSGLAVSGSQLWVANGFTNVTSLVSDSVGEFNVTTGRPTRIVSLAHVTSNYTGPSAIAVDRADVWVTDPSSDSVVEINKFTGVVVRVVTPGAGQFFRPYALAVADAHVWVANIRNNSLSELSAVTGSLIRVIRGGAYAFNQPFDMVSSGSRLWVMNDATGDPITELNAATGALIRVFNAKADAFGQFAMAVDGPHLWVTRWATNEVVELAASSGAVVRVVKFSRRTRFSGPTTIAAGGGRVWVTNVNKVVMLKEASGAIVRILRAPGYRFNEPAEIVTSGPHVFVANARGNSVTELRSANGSLLRVIK